MWGFDFLFKVCIMRNEKRESKCFIVSFVVHLDLSQNQKNQMYQ